MSQNKKGVLYYAPRILPDDTEANQDEKTDITENQKMDKKIKRFIHSIIREEKDKFHELLKEININGKNHSTNWTPLIWAIQKDRIYFIQQMFNTDQIVDFSKHIDHKTRRTTLHFAAEKSNLKLLMLLLQKDKSQKNVSDINKKIKLKVNAKDRENCTTLYRASKAGAALLIKALLQHDANPNIANRDGITPLMISSIKGHKAAVSALLNYDGTDINMKDKRGRTALMCACAEDRIDIVKLLLKCKNLDFKNAIDNENFNWNTLMWCIYRKNERMLNLLLDCDKNCDKIDYFYENYHNQTALEMCIKKKLSEKITHKIRAKYHAIVFPHVVQAEIVLNLNVPLVVVSQLLVFTY